MYLKTAGLVSNDKKAKAYCDIDRAVTDRNENMTLT